MDYSIMAFDYGDKRIGVALANSVAKLAHPLTTLQSDESAFGKIMQLMKEHRTKELIVGLPRNMQGEETAQSQECRKFAGELSKRSGIEVKMVDESLTSVLSEEHLNKSGQTYNKGEIDMHAAAAILQEYLDGTSG